MNQPPSKQIVPEIWRTKSQAYRARKASDKATGGGSDEGRKRVLSKMSVLGSLGSRLLFHRRADRMKIPKYQNTYRLEPFQPLKIEVVDRIIRETLEGKLAEVSSYQAHQAAKLSTEIASEIQRAVLKKDYDRYKLVVQVNIVQRLHQSLHSAFQYLWDTDRDNYSYYAFENNHIYAWCCVFSIYYE